MSHRKGRSKADHPSTNARALAWTILRRVEESEAYADALVGEALGSSRLDSRDEGLLTRLVYGTIAWQSYLDHVMAAFSRRAPADLDPPVRTLLRLALFQITILTRVPAFAAVNTAVELSKRFHGGAATGLVNALLRRAVSGWRDVRFPSRPDDPAGHLSIRLSHPRWLVERWIDQFGYEDTEALLVADNEAAPTTLRVNQRRIDRLRLIDELRLGENAELGSYSPVAVRLRERGGTETAPGYADGLFSLQGEASQLVAFLVDPQPGERVLDLCAAPGGKTTHLAELMDDRGEIVALDVNAAGIRRLRRMARRLRLTIVQPVVADALAWHPGSTRFDRLLVDAPCSGLGTLRQHPEIKWRRTPADVAARAELQRRLLLRAAPWVRPGGTLVYATCTISAPENEDVVAWFLDRHPAFALDDPRPRLPLAARELVGPDQMLHTFPHRHGLDGFFAARLKRRE